MERTEQDSEVTTQVLDMIVPHDGTYFVSSLFWKESSQQQHVNQVILYIVRVDAMAEDG